MHYKHRIALKVPARESPHNHGYEPALDRCQLLCTTVTNSCCAYLMISQHIRMSCESYTTNTTHTKSYTNQHAVLNQSSCMEQKSPAVVVT